MKMRTRPVVYAEVRPGEIELQVAFPEFDSLGRPDGAVVDIRQVVDPVCANARGPDYLRELIRGLQIAVYLQGHHFRLVPSAALRDLGV